MRILFASRWFRVAALLWVVGFFVIFVPAHRRGIATFAIGNAAAVDVSGSKGDRSAKPFCPLCVWTSTDGDQPVPTEAPMGCAVCLLKASLDLPSSAIEAPAFVTEIEFLIAHADAASAPLLSSCLTLRGRAPPQA